MFPSRIGAPILLALLSLSLSLPAALAQPSAGSATLADFHGAKAGLACTACHTGGDPTALMPEAALAAVNRQCQACHGDSAQVAKTTQAKLADPNINPHASHLVAVDCTVCHAGHTSARESYCIQCHAFTMPMPRLSGVGAK